jgi:hypothetical protein
MKWPQGTFRIKSKKKMSPRTSLDLSWTELVDYEHDCVNNKHGQHLVAQEAFGGLGQSNSLSFNQVQRII